MKITFYDLFDKSIVIGVGFILVGIFTGISILFMHDTPINSLLEFIRVENSNGDKIGKIALFEISIGIVWIILSKAIMASLKKGMTHEEIKKIDK